MVVSSFIGEIYENCKLVNRKCDFNWSMTPSIYYYCETIKTSGLINGNHGHPENVSLTACVCSETIRIPKTSGNIEQEICENDENGFVLDWKMLMGRVLPRVQHNELITTATAAVNIYDFHGKLFIHFKFFPCPCFDEFISSAYRGTATLQQCVRMHDALSINHKKSSRKSFSSRMA